MTAGARGGTVQHNREPWRGGVWMATDWDGSECVLRVAWAKNNDADGRRRRSGQASPAGRAGQEDRGEGETMRLGTGAEWAPCGIVQEGGCHSGDV